MRVCAVQRGVPHGRLTAISRVAKAVQNPTEIKKNLIDQLTAPVRWTQSVQEMMADGATQFVECGPGKTLQGLIKKIDRANEISGGSFE